MVHRGGEAGRPCRCGRVSVPGELGRQATRGGGSVQPPSYLGGVERPALVLGLQCLTSALQAGLQLGEHSGRRRRQPFPARLLHRCCTR